MPPSQLPPSLRVEIVQGRNVFPSIICKECDHFPTQHRCLIEVTTGGYLFDGLVVCGAAVCVICSAKFGQEGTFRCVMHAATSSERHATEPNEYATTFVTEKENRPPNTHQNTKSSTWLRKSQVMMDATNGAKADNEKKKATRECGLEYSATEILLLSKAWISASENMLTGAHQKINTFWDSVLKSYNVLKEQHKQYMQKEKDKDRFRHNSVRSTLGSMGIDIFEDSPSEDSELFQLPTRNVGSLQQKWSKKVQPLVFKFIGVTVRYPKRSGEDREAYYNRLHLIFLKENPSEKSFDIYRPSWEYLQDKPKFSVCCSQPTRKREVITLDNEESNKDIAKASEKIQPMGRNSMRRKVEEDKIMASISKKIESTTTSMSSQLSAALLQISTSIGSALTSWQMQLALPNCSADIQRQYYDLLVKKQIEAMTCDDVNKIEYSNVTPTD
jgi:hypothetical protein